MGFQGRYITWAAATVGGGILSFIIVYCILSLLPDSSSLLQLYALRLLPYLFQNKGKDYTPRRGTWRIHHANAHKM